MLTDTLHIRAPESCSPRIRMVKTSIWPQSLSERQKQNQRGGDGSGRQGIVAVGESQSQYFTCKSWQDVLGGKETLPDLKARKLCKLYIYMAALAP